MKLSREVIFRRRRWMLLAGLVIALLFVLGLQPQRPSKRTAFEAVNVGMTTEEMRNALRNNGCPGIASEDGNYVIGLGPSNRLYREGGIYFRVEVESGRVQRVIIDDGAPDDRSILERIRDEYRYQKLTLYGLFGAGGGMPVPRI